MAFGPIMRFKVGDLDIELAPLTHESMSEFVNLSHGGGMQRHQVTRYLGRRLAPTVEDEHEWFDKTRADRTSIVWGMSAFSSATPPSTASAKTATPALSAKPPAAR